MHALQNTLAIAQHFAHRDSAHIAMLRALDPGMQQGCCKVISAAALSDSWSDTPGAKAQ
jgi:hypothetical protein